MKGEAARLLDLTDLSVDVRMGAGRAPVLENVAVTLERGETLALVGESGCGKSMTALAVLRLLPPGARQVTGRVLLNGADVGTLSESELRRVRGGAMAVIFQEPMTALNPVLRISEQIAEVLQVHRGLRHRAANERVLELLRRVGIADPARRAGAYPHQLSGGMRQRAMIAMALAGEPQLLIADEPTTALDVTIQAQILTLLRERQQSQGLGVLLITHDLGVVAQYADRMAVMYAGRIVETGPVADVLRRPQHPYTAALLESVPRLDRTASPATEPSAGQSNAGSNARPRLPVIPGEVPRPGRRPGGCAFHPRCARADDTPECRTTPPPLEPHGPNRSCACWKASSVLATAG